uniref:C-type lectin domain-containing protein n=1 Tax=Graphocephala atropunctata TaxID=36148 RepID=A0A1B6LLQ9_9HEMI
MKLQIEMLCITIPLVMLYGLTTGYLRFPTVLESDIFSHGAQRSVITERTHINPVSNNKRYALSIFFKANWFRASQYCRYRGMRLATINSQIEEDDLEKTVERLGFEMGPVWTSGTDNAGERKFFWMSTGGPLTYSNWQLGEPNGNISENCISLREYHGEGYKWNNEACSLEYYFACEYFTANFTCNCNDLISYI